MDIGEPKREIYVEPLELPEPLRRAEPVEPERRGQPEPAEMPAGWGRGLQGALETQQRIREMQKQIELQDLDRMYLLKRAVRRSGRMKQWQNEW